MRRCKEDADQTRSNILNCALKIFAEKGITNTSLQEIADAASVTRGAIYWHFKNKLEIFEALQKRHYQPLTDMILHNIDETNADPIKQTQELCITLLIDMQNNAERRQFMQLFAAKNNYSGELAVFEKKHSALRNQSQELLAAFFIKAQQQGKLKKGVDSKVLAMAIKCYMKGIIMEYLANPKGINLEEEAPKLINQFFASVK